MHTANSTVNEINNDEKHSSPYRSPGWHEVVVEKLDSRGWMRWYRRVAIVQCLTILVGVVIAFIEIRTIAVSGSVLTCTGLICTILCVKAERRLGILFGLSGPAISICCFLLIFLQRWSPDDAQEPISGLALAYGIVFMPLGLLTIFRGRETIPSEPSPRTNET